MESNPISDALKDVPLEVGGSDIERHFLRIRGSVPGGGEKLNRILFGSHYYSPLSLKVDYFVVAVFSPHFLSFFYILFERPS